MTQDDEILAELDPMPDSTEMYGSMIEDAASAARWNRKWANKFLDYANELEDRAQKFRNLAAQLVIEARDCAEEVSTLIASEFPMEVPDNDSEDE